MSAELASLSEIPFHFPTAHPRLDAVGLRDEDENNLKQEIQRVAETLWLNNSRENSVVKKLANPVRRSLVGIDINLEENDPNSVNELETLNGLTQIIQLIAETDGSDLFLTWVSEQVSGPNKAVAANFVQTLLNFSTFIDQKSYQRLVHADENQLPLLPLHTLTVAAAYTREQVQDPALNFACKLFDSRFPFIYCTSNLQLDLKKSSNQRLISFDASRTTSTILNWVATQDVPQQNILRGALNYAIMHGAKNIEDIFPLFTSYGYSTERIQELREFAIEYDRIKATPEEQRDVIEKGKAEILGRVRIDANELDFSERITPTTDKIRFHLLTVTGAPWHLGHTIAVESVIEMLNEEKKSDGTNKTTDIFLIAPLLSAERLEGSRYYKKSASQVGEIRYRYWSIAAAMRNHGSVELTTSAQLAPSDNPDPLTWLNTLKTRIATQVSSTAGVEADIIRVIGADKIFDNDTSDNRVVQPPHDEFKGETCIVLRGDYLADALANLSQIRKFYPKSTIILTPGIQGSSSSLLVQTQDFSMTSLVGREVFNGYWDQSQIDERKRKGIKGIYEPTSVTQLDEELRQRIISCDTTDPE